MTVPAATLTRPSAVRSSRRLRWHSNASVSRLRWPVASRSSTRPVNVAFTSDASRSASSALMPSAIRPSAMSSRQNEICSARTSPGRPLTVASSVAASRPSRTSARCSGLRLIHSPPAPLQLRRGEVRYLPPPPPFDSALNLSGPPQCCDHQFVLAAEVMYQRVDRHPQVTGNWPQRHSGDAVPAEVADHLVQQLGSSFEVRMASHQTRMRWPAGSSTGSASSLAGRRWPMISTSNSAPGTASSLGT